MHFNNIYIYKKGRNVSADKKLEEKKSTSLLKNTVGKYENGFLY